MTSLAPSSPRSCPGAGFGASCITAGCAVQGTRLLHPLGGSLRVSRWPTSLLLCTPHCCCMSLMLLPPLTCRPAHNRTACLSAAYCHTPALSPGPSCTRSGPGAGVSASCVAAVCAVQGTRLLHPVCASAGGQQAAGVVPHTAAERAAGAAGTADAGISG